MENAANKLVLGTAQLGLDYGINNIDGKPSREKSLEMLDFAHKNGIMIFDTAHSYGDAEEILGEFLETNNLRNKIKIITKLKPDVAPTPNSKKFYVNLVNDLKESLKRLKTDSVDGCLFHAIEHIKDNNLVKCLAGLKDKGLVKNIGVSVYEVEDAIYAAKLDEVDYIQVPYNIFDQRLNKTDFFQLTRKNNKVIFTRSAFLQCLLLMAEENIPVHLKKVKKYLKRFDEIIGKYNLSRKEAALLFSLRNKNTDYVVFGVDNLQQLKELTNIAKLEVDFNPCKRELMESFANVERNIILPNLWKK